MKIDIGISEEDRRQIAEGLSNLLSDTYTLYLKTHNFHWNVTGSMFQTLHLMFEQEYTELANAATRSPKEFVRSDFPHREHMPILQNAPPSEKNAVCRLHRK